MPPQSPIRNLSTNYDQVKGINTKHVDGGEENIFEDKEDQFIWQAFRSNNESAFIFIYEKYFSDLINYGHQFTKESQLVEDCIQDLFIDLRKKRENLTNNSTSIKFYLYKALKRRIIEYRRKNKFAVVECIGDHKDFEIVPSIETNIIQDQTKEEQLLRMRQAFSQLTDRQREALFYLYYENLSYKEIKELMGMDHVRSARNIVYKAINVLKPLVKLIVILPMWM